MSNNNSFSGTDSFGSTTIPTVTGGGGSEKIGILENGSGIDLASQYALHVALQTMKERCITLQQRLLIVEEENSLLRSQTISKINFQHDNAQQKLTETTTEYLRKQIDELTQQKLQLTEHIAMVAAENRQLWSRLSHLAKNDKDDQQQLQQQQQQQYHQQRKQRNSGGNGQNLIRSRTFTQNSPNPLLRKKHLAAIAAAGGTVDDDDKSLEDLSLEEISLKDVDFKYNDNVEDYGNHATMMIENSKLHQDLIRSVTRRGRNDSFGFSYLNDDSSDGDGTGGNNITAGSNDLSIETKKCIDGIVDIKKKVLKQQNELTALLSTLKEKKELPPQECAECKYRSNNKPEMVDKIIETKDDLIDQKTMNQFYNSQNKSKTIIDEETLSATGGVGSSKNGISGGLENSRLNNIDFLEEKRRADKLDKMCPMCGKIFNETILFDEFEEHVETHFIDDTDLDAIAIERNFQFISNTVSNF